VKYKISLHLLVLLSVLGCVNLAVSVNARPVNYDKQSARQNKQYNPGISSVAAPNVQATVHIVGNMRLGISNYGFFGKNFGTSSGNYELGCEFPAESNIDYLYGGGLWIGAVVGDDTLVSNCQSQYTTEFMPNQVPDGAVLRRSSLPNDPDYTEEAISEEDFIVEYTDTVTDISFVSMDEFSNRRHKPLNLRIEERSYAWSSGYADDFIIFDYTIHSINYENLHGVYIGWCIDGDICHKDKWSSAEGQVDDICGFKHTVPSKVFRNWEDSIMIAWSADNDGDPNEDLMTFDYNTSPLGVTGVTILRSPYPEYGYSFNWFVFDYIDSRYDWSPMRKENYRNFGTGGTGDPKGDANKYFMLSNGEFDYDQIYAAQNYSDLGWLPPPSAEYANEIANGFDSRYLLSFGPFNLAAFDSLNVTFAFVAGNNFHKQPTNYMDNFDPNNPEEYYNRLDFSDLATNARMASWVYDNPGVDTDGDGFFGKVGYIYDTVMVNGEPEEVMDSFFYAGDGIPDFVCSSAPPAPQLRFSSLPSQVTLQWNGYYSENFRDPFSQLEDFEGYRVYISREQKSETFAFIASADKVNYNRYKYSQIARKWKWTEAPFTLDSLKEIYGQDFEPDEYSIDNPLVDGETGEEYYFERNDWNQDFTTSSITKIYQDEIDQGLISADTGSLSNPQNYYTDPETGEEYHKFYEYEYIIRDLLPSVPYYFSVTAFDYGDPINDLEPTESSILSNVLEGVYAMNTANNVLASGAQVIVYPNPYRIDGGYSADGYEYDLGDPERNRRINFMNLPPECIIKIWTVDGDLVREIKHGPGERFSEMDSKAYWDMISRNTQLITTGMYIYSVESEYGTQMGKFLILK